MAKKSKTVILELEKDLNEITQSLDDSRSINWKERKKAQKALELAKEREKDKVNHVWMSKDKTSKLVHPGKIVKNLADGWKISKMNKKLKK